MSFSFSLCIARAAVVAAWGAKGEEKDYRQSWDPIEREKKTTDEAKTPRRRKRLQSWDPAEKTRLQTKWRPHGEKKDYRWSQNPMEKKKTPDKVETPWRRKGLQTKPRPHRKEKTTKWRPHGEEKDYRQSWDPMEIPTDKVKTTEMKTKDKAEDPMEKKMTTDKLRPHGDSYRQSEDHREEDKRQSWRPHGKEDGYRQSWRPHGEEDYRQGWDPTLLGLTQVNVDEFSSPAVYQDVHHVAIAQSQDVAHWNTHSTQHPSTFGFTAFNPSQPLTFHSL